MMSEWFKVDQLTLGLAGRVEAGPWFALKTVHGSAATEHSTREEKVLNPLKHFIAYQTLHFCPICSYTNPMNSTLVTDTTRK